MPESTTSPSQFFYTTSSRVAAFFAMIIAIVPAGCQRLATDGGDFGESGSESGADDDDSTIPPRGDTACVEMSPGQVTCWIEWGEVWARVMPDCQVDELVSAAVWGPMHEEDLGDQWGLVPCFDVISTDATLCLWSDENVLLFETIGDWSPELSSVIGMFDPVAEPCAMPSCPVGELGCPCESHACAPGLTCAEAEDGATACGPKSEGSSCDHGLPLVLPGISVDGACVAQCAQGDGCGPMTCSPNGPFASDGFCAWPP